MEKGALFVEVQRFGRSWLWIILMANLALVTGLFGYGVFRQFVQNQPWGNKPMSDEGLIVVTVLAFVLSVGLLWLFKVARLEVRVEPDALSVHFRPFSHRRIPYSDIVHVEGKTYRPLLDYGGWGIRWAPSRGIAYNVSGNRGVLLELRDGKRVLLGSRQAEALAEAIKQKVGIST